MVILKGNVARIYRFCERGLFIAGFIIIAAQQKKKLNANAIKYEQSTHLLQARRP